MQSKKTTITESWDELGKSVGVEGLSFEDNLILWVFRKRKLPEQGNVGPESTA